MAFDSSRVEGVGKLNSSLQDQAERDAFIQDIRGSYSVIAPAGVGKTESIIRRIAQLALLPRVDSEFSLGQLVVVTYTKAAASEMQERTRQRLLEEGHSPEIMAQFNQGFFGTIHSFCDGIAREWGPRVGLRSDFEIETDTEALFIEFMRSESDLTRLMPDAWREALVRLVDVWKVLECLKNPEPLEKVLASVDPGPLPEVDLTAVLQAELKRGSAKLDRYKAGLQGWLENWLARADYTGLPEAYKHDHIDAAFGESLGALFEWVSRAAIFWLRRVDEAFFGYRCRVGRLYFSDTVRVVNNLLKDEFVAKRLYSKNSYIILDEAQDTDPSQFKMLLGLCGVSGLDSDVLAVRDAEVFSRGRWCMVGDFQQSIYKSRANVSLYREIHDRLESEGLIKGLTFSVTFRCDEEIVSWVNRAIEPVFEAGTGVDFVPLMARPEAGAGRVVKIVLDSEAVVEDEVVFEAERIAQVIAEQGLEGLGVEDWSQCALLCPRKAQLSALEKALAGKGLRAQKLSDAQTYQSLPEFAWPVALLKIMADPENAFEIASVLREVFGVSDESIYRFVHEAPMLNEGLADTVSVLQIRKPSPLGGDVAEVLNYLQSRREDFFKRTHIPAVDGLFEAVNLRERLKIVLRGEREDKIEPAVERILLEGIQLYEKYGSWGRVVESLEKSFLQQVVESDETRAGHLQLLTCHKSKGLQWDVVMVPFIWKGISKPQESYPSLVGIQQPAQVCFVASSSDPGKSIIQQRDMEAVDELRRLLYVAVTRAKHSLVLVDDSALFGGRQRGLTSFGKLLGASDGDPFEGLDEWSDGVTPSGVAAAVRSRADSQDSEEAVVAHLEFRERRFWRRVLPSSLGHREDFESREAASEAIQSSETDDSMRSHSSAQGAEYGTWWHDCMEALWEGRSGSFPELEEVHALSAWKRCPDTVRATDEFSKLLENRSLQDYFGASVRVMCEVPFLWKDPDSEYVYDGYVD
ncbi:MAG: UvrD-helicase domain-containing protein, partial [Verrucomicrobiota bacterium]